MIYTQDHPEFLIAVQLLDKCRDVVKDEEIDEFYMLTGFDLRCYGIDDFDLQKGDNFVMIELTDEGVNIQKGKYETLEDIKNDMYL